MNSLFFNVTFTVHVLYMYASIERSGASIMLAMIAILVRVAHAGICMCSNKQPSVQHIMGALMLCLKHLYCLVFDHDACVRPQQQGLLTRHLTSSGV